MKTKYSALIIAASLFLSVSSAGAQQNSSGDEKKVTITKRIRHSDGSETSETIVKKGKSAEGFSLDQYLKENKADNAFIDVKIEGGGEDEVRVTTGKKYSYDWERDVDRAISTAKGAAAYVVSGNSSNRAFLGVEQDSDEDSDEDGVVVEIIRGSAAEKAGLRHNDVILKLNDKSLREWDDLSNFMDDVKPGEKIKITYRRNGKESTVEAMPTKRSEVKSSGQKAPHGFLGVSSDDENGSKPGVRVNITSNSGADKAGLEDGDIILQLDDTEVSDMEDISDFMEYTKPDDKVKITYKRDGEKKTTEAVLGEQQDWNWSNGNISWGDGNVSWGGNNFSFSGSKWEDKRGFLGVDKSENEDEDAPGLAIEVFEGSAAEKAGLKDNDLIMKLDNTDIEDWGDFTDFMEDTRPGEKVKITYKRDGKENVIEADLSKRSEVKISDKNKKTSEGFLGVSQYGNDDDDEPGVRVSITKKSAAEKAGLRKGDIIYELNDKKIEDWEDIEDFMDNTKAGELIKVTYERNGERKTVEATLDEQEMEEWFDGWRGGSAPTAPEPGNMRLGSLEKTAPVSAYAGTGNGFYTTTPVAAASPKSSGNCVYNIRKKEACLGVYSANTGKGSSEGAGISGFTTESAAEEASLKLADVILSVNGKRVRNHDDLWEQIAQYLPGEKIKVNFMRDKETMCTEATLRTCADNAAHITVYNTDEAGDNSSRQFYAWNWNEVAQKKLSERHVITIRRGAEGDAPKINTAPEAGTADEAWKPSSFRFAPSGSKGQFTVSFRAEPVATIFSLLDQSGRQLFREELNAFGGVYVQQFDLNEFAGDKMIAHIQQADQTFTEELNIEVKD